MKVTVSKSLTCSDLLLEEDSGITEIEKRSNNIAGISPLCL
jgi:hypothetical protein